MTQTALKNKEIESKEKIEAANRAHKTVENEKDRKFKRREARKERAAGILGKLIPTGKFTLNDPKFYKRYLTDLDKWTQVSTYTRLGAMTFNGAYGKYSNGAENTLPGIVIAEYYPVINYESKTLTTTGGSNRPISTNAINQILMRTKEQVLKSNSRSNVPWEAGDLGFNLIATGAIIRAISELERVAYVAQTFKANNAYLGDTLIYALGFDPDDVRRNLPLLRRYIILLQQRFNNALVAPKDLTYYARQLFISKNLFRDSEAEPFQIYGYRSKGFHQLSDDATTLEFVSGFANATVEKAYSTISLMIQRISENPDFIAMYADLRSAFTDNLLQLEVGMDETREIQFVYDKLMGEQFMNIKTLPAFIGTDDMPNEAKINDLTIRQDSSGYLYQGALSGEFYISWNKALFETDNPAYQNILEYENKHHSYVYNMDKTDITGDDILEITRCTPSFGQADNTVSGSINQQIVSSGTELVNSMWVYVIRRKPTGWDRVTHVVYSDYYNISPQYSWGEDVIRDICALNTFAWVPFVNLIWMPENGSANSVQRIFLGKTQNTFLIPNANIESLNDACVMSLFYIDSNEFKRSGTK